MAFRPTMLYRAAMDELFARLEAQKPPEVVLAAFGTVLENPVKLFCAVGNSDSTCGVGAVRIKPGLYASDLFVKLLAAVRALDWKIVIDILEHTSLPDRLSNIRIASGAADVIPSPLPSSGAAASAGKRGGVA